MSAQNISSSYDLNFSFFPDAERADALDHRMRSELARSLEHVVQSIQSQMPGTEAAESSVKLMPVVDLLGTNQRVNPGLFARYYQLVFAALEGAEELPDLIDRVVDEARPIDGMIFSEMSEKGLGSAGRSSLYHDCFNTDERLSFGFLPPDAEEAERTRASVERALALMQETVPEFAAEFKSLVSEVVLAAASKEPEAARFDGGSSYMLWGRWH